MDDDRCRRLLEQPITIPADPDRFTSNTLFGQPGIYPEGSPMIPAAGPARSSDELRRIIERLSPDDGRAIAGFEAPDLVERVPDETIRAALCLLADGPAAPIFDAFASRSSAAHTFGVGDAGVGRVVGAPVDAPPGHRVVDRRYAFEHPAAIAPSLAHAICHHCDGAGDAEEATLHGVLAAVHAHLLASDPALADLGTELARRQSSLTITLLNARAPGSWRASICCPDGAGTIPGGNPSLQCPDLWSIPFTGHTAAPEALGVPDPVRETLGRLTGGASPEVPTRYDDELGCWLQAQLGTGPWFGPVERVAAGRALGLFC